MTERRLPLQRRSTRRITRHLSSRLQRSHAHAPAGGAPAGAFIVLVGPDGTGKTTVARAIVESAQRPTAYFHFRPAIGRPMAAAPPSQPAAPPPKAEGGARWLGWVRLARAVGLTWSSYLLTIRPAVARGDLVIGDRWVYGYAVQPEALRFAGPAWLATLALRIMPRPDVVVNLAAPTAEIRRRKQELTAEQVDRELRAWRALPVRRLITVRSDQPTGVIVERILTELA